jgi:hypothetical protein
MVHATRIDSPPESKIRLTIERDGMPSNNISVSRRQFFPDVPTLA